MKAFYASPYSQDYGWVRDAVAVACRRAKIDLICCDEQKDFGKLITDNMKRLMQDCDFGIVVTSGLNPNALYEQGFLEALGKAVLVLHDGRKDLPFDLGQIPAIIYREPETERISPEIARDILENRVLAALPQVIQSMKDSPADRAVPKRPVFGYFYYRVEGFERVLIHKLKTGEWDFPVKGELPVAMPVRNAVDAVMRAFLDQNRNRRNWFYKMDFEQPEIMEIYTCQRQASDNQICEMHPIFFKIRVNRRNPKLPEKTGEYGWASKSLLFRNLKLREVGPGGVMTKDRDCYPSDPKLLWYIRNDKIMLECGLKVLDCVDVLTYRERDRTHEFLLLHRREDHDPAKNSMWEYPKGGLEYHESHEEAAIRELLEETGMNNFGMFRYGGALAQTTPDVSDRGKAYDTLRVRGLTYRLIGEEDLDPERLSDEHDRHQWTNWQQAGEKTWMPYGKLFLKRWQELESEIHVKAAPPVSLAFQVTEQCPHSCLYCHRRKESERQPKIPEICEMIDHLARRRILRLTFTGGEPLLLGKELLFEAIKYANKRGIHTCLSSTGIAGKGDAHRLVEKDLQDLGSCLDHLLISLNCIDERCAKATYGDLEDWRELREMAMCLLKPRPDCGFFVEVCTVVTAKNIDSITAIGNTVFRLNPEAFWRIDEYYPNGHENSLGSSSCMSFELGPTRFAELKEEILQCFPTQSKSGRIRFNTRASRLVAPDVMLTPGCNLVRSANSEYCLDDYQDLRIRQFENRRPYEEYRTYCRPWYWDAQVDWGGCSGLDEFRRWYGDGAEEIPKSAEGESR